MSTSAVIREIRQEQKMQIGQLAKLSGLHRNTVYRVEKGDDISVSNFEKLLKVFGYELEVMKCKEGNLIEWKYVTSVTAMDIFLSSPFTSWSVLKAISIALAATAKEKSMKKIWKRLKRKENWESRMGPEYFLLIVLGSVISVVLTYWY